jgi:RNA polymerase sigma-70 factor, ECF subfamily
MLNRLIMISSVSSGRVRLSARLPAAVETWPRSGVPREPLAWLATTARRKALDRSGGTPRWPPSSPPCTPRLIRRAAHPVPEHEHIPDDRSQLMFACCHPALDLDTQTGLTVRRASELAQAPAGIAYLTSRAEKYTTPG